VRLLFFVYVARDFLKLVPWFLLNFIGVHGLGMDGWYSLGIFDHVRFFCLGCLFV